MAKQYHDASEYESVRFFISPHWVIGQCGKIISERFLKSLAQTRGYRANPVSEIDLPSRQKLQPMAVWFALGLARITEPSSATRKLDEVMAVAVGGVVYIKPILVEALGGERARSVCALVEKWEGDRVGGEGACEVGDWVCAGGECRASV